MKAESCREFQWVVLPLSVILRCRWSLKWKFSDCKTTLGWLIYFSLCSNLLEAMKIVVCEKDRLINLLSWKKLYLGMAAQICLWEWDTTTTATYRQTLPYLVGLWDIGENPFFGCFFLSHKTNLCLQPWQFFPKLFGFCLRKGESEPTPLLLILVFAFCFFLCYLMT